MNTRFENYVPSTEEAILVEDYEVNTGNLITQAYKVNDTRSFWEALDWEMAWYYGELDNSITPYTPLNLSNNTLKVMKSITDFRSYIKTKHLNDL